MRGGARAGPVLQPGALFEAVVATIANDDVVEHVHAEQRAGINEATCQLDVVSAGARIAAGMIVREDDRCGVCQQRRLEHLARMDERRVKRASAHLVIGDHAMLRGQAEDSEDLARLILQRSHQCRG